MTAIPLRERPRWYQALAVWHVVAWVLVAEWLLMIGGTVAAALLFDVEPASASRGAGFALLWFTVSGVLVGFALDLFRGALDDV